MTAHQEIVRKAELFEESLESYLKQRGWSQVMIGWYWVWTKSCKLKSDDGHCHQLERSLGIGEDHLRANFRRYL